MNILRISTAGSVDDGKSTLIGRLLHDTGSLSKDKLEAIRESSKRRGKEGLDLSLITDGLLAEREQGITIDVAHIYFATEKRKFIIADTPGHVEYTRNMVTGASNAELAIILLDARNGVVEQTRRHFYISALLGIPETVVAINKMDLIGYKQEVYQQIREEFEEMAQSLDLKLPKLTFIPVSAKYGDNVVGLSSQMNWYEGPTLLPYLESVEPDNLQEGGDRFPVQWVIRPQSEEFHDFRGYAGKVSSGHFAKGQEITVLPSGLKSKIARIYTYDGDLEEAQSGQSVTFLLEDDIDISRGDLIVSDKAKPREDKTLEARLCWMDNQALRTSGRYILRQGPRRVQAKVAAVVSRVDPATLEESFDNLQIGLNDIAKVSIRTAQPLFFDNYAENKANGSFILVDAQTNNTVAAGMIGT